MANKPVKVLKVGWAECAIWESAGRYSASFKKRYKDKEGQYKDTTFFDSVDCAAIVVLGHQASAWMELQKQITRNASQGIAQAAPTGNVAQAASFDDDDIPF